MKKNQNKSLKFAATEIVLVLAVLVSFLVCGYFLNENAASDGKFNIADTEVDFIIPSPGKEQVEQMRKLDHVSAVVPYYYTSQNTEKNGVNVKTDLFVINSAEELGNTVFSDELLIKRGKTDVKNPLFVSDVFAAAAKVGAGDTVSFTLFGTEIEFNIVAVYKDDHRAVSGTVIAVLTDDLAKAANEGYRYMGAYVSSSDVDKTKEYLESYKPTGDLRPREDFASDESYQAYLKSREETDYTNSIFYKAEYLADCEARYGERGQGNMAVRVIAGIIAVTVAYAVPFARAKHYGENDAKRDLRNNFTVSGVAGAVGDYFAKVLVTVVLCCAAGAIFHKLIWGLELLSFDNVLLALTLLLAVLFSRGASVSAIRKKFSRSL